eukprot:6446578-Pyramimonas_sp.AAC.2
MEEVQSTGRGEGGVSPSHKDSPKDKDSPLEAMCITPSGEKKTNSGLAHFMVCGNLFEVDSKYNPIKPIGKGAYGIVWCVTTTIGCLVKFEPTSRAVEVFAVVI